MIVFPFSIYYNYYTNKKGLKMNEQMLEQIGEQLKKDKAYFLKYGVKSQLLRMGQRFLGLDNEDFLKELKGSK